MRSEPPELAGPAKRCLGALDTVSWPWIPVLGSLEPPRQDGENAQKMGKNGEKMGEIRPKRCEGRELTKDQLAGNTDNIIAGTPMGRIGQVTAPAVLSSRAVCFPGQAQVSCAKMLRMAA